MAQMEIERVVVKGKTDAEMKKLGISLKPLHEVRLRKEDTETLDAILKKKANAALRMGDFAALEKLGMLSGFYREAIADVAQRYEKNTSHDFHISELSRIGGFAPFETAMIIIEAAEKLAAGGNTDATARIMNSAAAIQKIVEKLPEEEEQSYLLLLAGNLRRAKPQQHNYPDTHYVDEQGVRVPKNLG